MRSERECSAGVEAEVWESLRSFFWWRGRGGLGVFEEFFWWIMRLRRS